MFSSNFCLQLAALLVHVLRWLFFGLFPHTVLRSTQMGFQNIASTQPVFFCEWREEGLKGFLCPLILQERNGPRMMLSSYRGAGYYSQKFGIVWAVVLGGMDMRIGIYHTGCSPYTMIDPMLYAPAFRACRSEHFGTLRCGNRVK